MAIGSSSPTIEVDQYNGKLTSFVILSCMVASIGGVIFGYEVAISEGVASTEPFLEKFFPSVLATMKKESDISNKHQNYYKLHRHLLTTFTLSMYLAGMLASLMAGPVTEKHGRRRAMMIGGAASIAGAAVGGGAGCVSMLLLGRLMVGVGVGFANQAVPIYISEIALPSHRGSLIVLFRLNQSLGLILASLVNFTSTKLAGRQCWRFSLALASLPASCLLLGAAFLPETPASLVQRGGNVPDAVGLLQRMRGASDIITELNGIATASSPSEKRAITHRRYRPQLITATTVSFFSEITICNSVTHFAPIILPRLGRSSAHPPSVLASALALALVGSAANLAAAAALDRLGRRFLLLTGGALMAISQTVIGVSVSTAMDGACVVLSMTGVSVLAFEVSWGPAGWLLPAESFPLEVRSRGFGVAVAARFLAAGVLGREFVVGRGSMGYLFRDGRLFYMFGGWVGLVSGFVWFFVPEMMGLGVEQVEVVWRVHWFWGRMVAGEDEVGG